MTQYLVLKRFRSLWAFTIVGLMLVTSQAWAATMNCTVVIDGEEGRVEYGVNLNAGVTFVVYGKMDCTGDSGGPRQNYANGFIEVLLPLDANIFGNGRYELFKESLQACWKTAMVAQSNPKKYAFVIYTRLANEQIIRDANQPHEHIRVSNNPQHLACTIIRNLTGLE